MTAAASDGTGPVAFIGLGMMGRPMAERLVAAGFDLRGVDTDAAARQALAAAGARVFENARTAVADCDIVVTMLPDGAVVRDALLGAGGVAGFFKEGTLVVDMSSSVPMGTRLLGAGLLEKGIALVDAPVSGGVARARDGSLCIMAGGREVDIARARPLLDAMGTTVIHAGPLGSGHAAKALNNYVSAAGLAAACEATLIGEAFGVDPGTLVDILNASTGRNNSTEVKLKPHILSGSFASGFAMALMAKDLHTASDLATELGMTACGAEQAAALWSAALADLGQGADHTLIHAFLKKRARARKPV